MKEFLKLTQPNDSLKINGKRTSSTEIWTTDIRLKIHGIAKKNLLTETPNS